MNAKIWLEVFRVPGRITSDNELEMCRNAVFQHQTGSNPVKLFDRPGTESWVSPPEPVLLKKIQEFFIEGGIPVDITGFDEITPLLAQDDSIALIDETLRRRPCTAEDIAQMTGLQARENRKKLALMVPQGTFQPKSSSS